MKPDSLCWFSQRRSRTPHVAVTWVTAGCSDCASKLEMWRHLANVIGWSDKFHCDIWLLSTQNCIGLWLQNSNSAEIFVRCNYPPSFIILCLLVWKLSCWQTRKQIPAKTSNVLRYAMTLGNTSVCFGEAGIPAPKKPHMARTVLAVTLQRHRLAATAINRFELQQQALAATVQWQPGCCEICLMT